MKTGELVKGNRGQKFSGWDVEVRRTNLRAESKAIESERNLKLMPSGEARKKRKRAPVFSDPADESSGKAETVCQCSNTIWTKI